MATAHSEFWRGKRVLVTGHTGFKGSWLCAWLQALGADVTGYALEPSTEPDLYSLAGIGDGMASIIGDVRDRWMLDEVMQRIRPQIVLHLAGQPLVRRGFAEPEATFAINMMGTVNLLAAAQDIQGLRSIVVVTSDKCYANRTRRPCEEGDRLGGEDPYSASKACAEIAVVSFRSSFRASLRGQGIATARAGNVIGGGDWSADRLIPDLITACIKEETPQLRYPKAVRPWQHVLEPVSGYLLLAEALWYQPERYAEAWNFGPEQIAAWSVGNIAEEVLRLWGAPAWSMAQDTGPEEDPHLTLSAAKAKAHLGWRPRLSIAQALRWTVDWYRAERDGSDVLDCMLRQIEAYQIIDAVRARREKQVRRFEEDMERVKLVS